MYRGVSPEWIKITKTTVVLFKDDFIFLKTLSKAYIHECGELGKDFIALMMFCSSQNVQLISFRQKFN